MKVLFTPILCPAAILLLQPSLISAQTFVYNFSAPTLKVNNGNSGLATGSIWLYSRIDASGRTDAIVKITNATGGLSLSTFDQDNTSNGGYTQAFQPTINVPPGTTVNGYIEFQFTFIKTGTYSATTETGIALPQTSIVPATVLDDDGTKTGGTLYEYDALNLGSGEAVDYDASGGQLSYSSSGSYITGTNITGNNYSGISTSATAVMFTVINTNISTLTFRTGVISDFTTTPAGRVSSLAFYLPTYSNSVLASSPIKTFQGTETNDAVQLHWHLASAQGLSTLDLERSVNNGSFEVIGSYELADNDTGSGSAAPATAPTPGTFTDANAPSGAAIAYRLKATSITGNCWYSEALGFRILPSGRFCFHPNPVVHTAMVSLAVTTSGSGILRLMDCTGHVISSQQVVLNHGNNSFYFQRPTGLPAGIYIVVMQAGAENFMEKIVLAAEGN